jgi:DNA modification methylase
MTCHFGDCRDVMRRLIAGGVKVQMACTSPPYWGLRDYQIAGQLGLETTPEDYVANMVEVFRLVRELLHDEGTLWLNLGDSYAQNGGSGWQGKNGQRADRRFTASRDTVAMRECMRRPPDGLKAKDLVGIPWMVAFALRADGWYLRSDIIWAKPNPMPESVTDRPTKSHEYLFLLAKSERYFYDAAAIAEPVSASMLAQLEQGYDGEATKDYAAAGAQDPSAVKARILSKSGNKERKGATERSCPAEGTAGSIPWEGYTRNKRTVWTVPTSPYAEAHFATFPPALIEPCILAGSRPGDTVLDPFLGSGTTGEVCQRLGRQWIGCELNEAYRPLQERRTAQQGMVFA